MAPTSSSRSKPRRRQQKATTAPLIKGYLPVRLCLPTTTDEEGRISDDTFFYVKEHRDNNNTTTSSTIKNKSTTTTLFVANAPVIPPVSTKLLLKSIFGRYGDVTRVTVVPNPRHFKHQPNDVAAATVISSSSVDEGIRWTNQFAAPSYFHHAAILEEQGRFAHVVFSSTKELNACLSSLHQVMSAGGDVKNARNSSKADDDDIDSSSSDDDEDDDDDDEGSHGEDSNNEEKRKPQSPGLVLDPIELQTLADETDRLYREEHCRDDNNNDDDDSDDDDNQRRKQQQKKPSSRVVRVAERYRETCCTTSRDRKDLLEECNRVMQQYDDEQARVLAATMGGDGEPLVDDDGFVTVSYGNNNSGGAAIATGKRALDEAPIHEQGQKRRKGQKRSRGSKKGPGALELADFYRFQTKENRKKTLHELREQFEQDLAKVQKMKQERQYRPF